MAPPSSETHRWRDELATAWSALCAELGLDTAAAAALGSELIDRYAEPHRHHHDVEHLAAVLRTLTEIAHPEAPPAEARLAAWFHDAIYEGRASDDEERSAELAERRLPAVGLSPPRAGAVAGMVRSTAGHLAPDAPAPPDHATAMLLDADLAILGADAGLYDRYAQRVRAEHPDVPEAAFRAGRARALRTLLAREPLFHTAAGRRRFEATARTNLRRELARLEPGTPSP